MALDADPSYVRVFFTVSLKWADRPELNEVIDEYNACPNNSNCAIPGDWPLKS